MSNTNKNKYDKKTNVINRTTSETLRLGDNDVCINHRVVPATNNHSIQVLPPVPRKKIQPSSSSFQITGVSLTRSDFGDDSADDLDESHTDDISRVTDNETPSFSEDSRDTDDHQLYENINHANHNNNNNNNNNNINNINTQIAANNNQEICTIDLNNQIIEIQKTIEESPQITEISPIVESPQVRPLQRGRWTCVDYFDQRAINNINVTCIFAGDSFMKDNGDLNLKTVGQIQQVPVIGESSKNQIFMDQGPSSVENRKAKDNANDILTDIKVALKSQQPQSSPNRNNIDRKIEEALDAVKTHLMVAVHKEVDFLKTRVSTLEGRVNELEIENSLLRVNYLLFKS